MESSERGTSKGKWEHGKIWMGTNQARKWKVRRQLSPILAHSGPTLSAQHSHPCEFHRQGRTHPAAQPCSLNEPRRTPTYKLALHGPLCPPKREATRAPHRARGTLLPPISSQSCLHRSSEGARETLPEQKPSLLDSDPWALRERVIGQSRGEQRWGTPSITML